MSGPENKQTIKTLIVDDESPARERISDLLEGRINIDIIGSCSTGNNAIEIIRSKSPDLVFLDIQLQDMNGFEVLEKINKVPFPIIVFVTAHDEYALKAFEFHALDYLLKPFSDERFEEALGKAIIQSNQDTIDQLSKKLSKVIADFNSNRNPAGEVETQSGQYKSRIAIKTARKIYFVETDDIDWIGSEGPYVSINARGKSHLLRNSLTKMERILSPSTFMRISRSAIINFNKVREMHSHFHGEFFIVLLSGKKLKLSRNYRENAEKLLGYIA